MLTTPRRRFAGSRTLTTSLALAASVSVTPVGQDWLDQLSHWANL